MYIVVLCPCSHPRLGRAADYEAEKPKGPGAIWQLAPLGRLCAASEQPNLEKEGLLLPRTRGGRKSRETRDQQQGECALYLLTTNEALCAEGLRGAEEPTPAAAKSRGSDVATGESGPSPTTSRTEGGFVNSSRVKSSQVTNCSPGRMKQAPSSGAMRPVRSRSRRTPGQ